ncbi:flocculation protein FLO11 [Polypterus senegalus]|uniref:flocculation protein FLO11 n=1 Tax=Polypterus senegalus TaxID=55291 RepID=UPI0019639E9E|nr:flocculation protein FLO11 [Polypterus senegalus]
MKKGTLSRILGRKENNPSLYKTKPVGSKLEISGPTRIDVPDLDKVLGYGSVPDTGTAKVRARPTVKLSPNFPPTDSDVPLGHAVPLPTVPGFQMGPGTGVAGNGVNFNNNTNGNLITNGFPDDTEEEIFIPPPPDMAPPPPPSFPPPPPPPSSSFLNSPLISTPSSQVDIPHPGMPPPPPPPTPPSEMYSFKDPEIPSYISEESSSLVPVQRPKYAPPPPPPSSLPKQNSSPFPSTINTTQPPSSSKVPKVPPPKPLRYSSISQLDVVSLQPDPPQDFQSPMPSSFKPQNTAKLYRAESDTTPSKGTVGDKKVKPLILMHGSASEDQSRQVNGYPPPSSVRRNSSGMQPGNDLTSNGMPTTTIKLSETKRHTNEDSFTSAIALAAKKRQEKIQVAQLPDNNQERSLTKPVETPQVPVFNSPAKPEPLAPSFKPLKETSYAIEELVPSPSVPKDNTVSPLAMLFAAKQRSRNGSLSRQNSNSSNNSASSLSFSTTMTSSSMTIQQSEQNPNSFIISPKANKDNKDTVAPAFSPGPMADPKPTLAAPSTAYVPSPVTSLSQTKERSKPDVKSTDKSSMSLLDQILLQRSAFINLPDPEAAQIPEPPMDLDSVCRDSESGELNCMFIPPPPEFANYPTEESSTTEEMASPTLDFNAPLIETENKYTVPMDTDIMSNAFAKTRGPPTPSTAPPAIKMAPKLPRTPTDFKPKIKAKPQITTQLSSENKFGSTGGQVTLQSILQKKMMEVDLKTNFKPVEDSSSDAWANPEPKISKNIPSKVVIPSQIPSKPAEENVQPAVAKDLVLNELKTKVKSNNIGEVPKSPVSTNKPKQAYGMSFTVRPGTKKPITLIHQQQN